MTQPICAISTFYRADNTKDRAKDLINELSSQERRMLLTVIKQKDDTLPQNLIDKLSVISLSEPIAREKDEKLSSCSKFVMNIWRAVKEFFGTRISDEKLLKKIEQFALNAGLKEMDAAKMEVDADLQEEDSIDWIFVTDNLISKIAENPSLDQLSGISMPLKQLEEHFGHSYIRCQVKGDIRSQTRIKNYIKAAYVEDLIKTQFSLDNTTLTLSQLHSKIMDKGVDHLTLSERNMIRLFIENKCRKAEILPSSLLNP